MRAQDSPVLAPRRPRALAVAALLAAALQGGGCEEESVVLIQIDASASTLAHLDTLEITVAASRTASGDALCSPVTRTFQLDPVAANRVELPLVIAVKPGATYDRVLYVRVVGRFADSIRLKTERIASLQGGEVTLRIPLTSDCLYRGIGRTQHCVNGEVEESILAPILEDGRYVEEGTPCLAD